MRTSESRAGRAWVLGCAMALSIIVPSCAKGPARPVVAVGNLGSGLATQADAVPQGAAVCAYRRALEDPRSKDTASLRDACKDAINSDELWSRAMIVLGAYADNLSELGSRTDPETTGHIAAHMSGVKGANWIEVGGDEKAARDAVTKLVEQLAAREEKTDLQEAVKLAAPQVKTICTGIDAYFEKQKRELQDLQQKLEEARKSPTTRRCTLVDGRSFCVADSVVDAVSYADALAYMAVLQRQHERASRSTKGFCVGHAKLAEAAERGDAVDEKTYGEVLEAVRTGVK